MAADAIDAVAFIVADDIAVLVAVAFAVAVAAAFAVQLLQCCCCCRIGEQAREHVFRINRMYRGKVEGFLSCGALLLLL